MPRARAAAGVEVYFVAFDLLAVAGDDVRGTPLASRRARLEEVFAGARPPLQLPPSTRDRAATGKWMRAESAQVGIEGVVAKKVDGRYRAGRTGDWVKVRQKVVVDAVVIGVAGPLTRPEALLLARPDVNGVLLPVGLSLPLPPAFRDEAAGLVVPTGEPRRRLPTTVLGQEGSEYVPVRPTLVVEAEAEATVMTFSARLRPRIHRFRTDLTHADLSAVARPVVE